MNKVFANANLPNALYQAVERELNPPNNGAGRTHETVLWVVQPSAKHSALSALPIVFFGVPWSLITVFWMAATVRSGGAFALFGVPFVFIGLAMLLSPLLAAWDARQTVYVITNRRILFVTVNGKTTTVKNYVPENESDLERTERASGSGDLVFLRRPTRDSDGDRTTERVSLTGIPDVRRVELLLRDTFFAPQAVAMADASNQFGHTVLVTPSTSQTSAAPWYTAHRG